MAFTDLNTLIVRVEPMPSGPDICEKLRPCNNQDAAYLAKAGSQAFAVPSLAAPTPQMNVPVILVLPAN
ncbi:hypothetical protein CLAFUW4_08011 [Fulvia fulva]|uniref:Uncharacterized protein n=1 Tax=Passalora fulva TaxID=5499 RepID=A0A9Q8LDU4_PASFU|nr:uncharacterized protein CLAFUR5_08133 [Fulvia fulva]KAK4629130.1 hypothetical protein CLAFUR4_08016 [Fulvia fulva]KAK4630569.1 hypothetical protein CLAFUR0_08012 [Fulvia fulva]UJO14858.1 hypothetical protein CLAFUR5_08133 [Fulvia fulva]WPV12979.1 hypothetical protein CLAFUW4_08011 [Fulvia fulva]WPV27094.1 hypothetical protein CLAFUW7_08011 [Fulvia fulva]